MVELKKNTGEADLIYNRMRSALSAQLRVVSWSLAKVALAEFERLALEDAIQRVEVECRKLAVFSRVGAMASTPPDQGAPPTSIPRRRCA
jgi:hypothetical protein